MKRRTTIIFGVLLLTLAPERSVAYTEVCVSPGARIYSVKAKIEVPRSEREDFASALQIYSNGEFFYSPSNTAKFEAMLVWRGQGGGYIALSQERDTDIIVASSAECLNDPAKPSFRQFWQDFIRWLSEYNATRGHRLVVEHEKYQRD